MSDETIFCDALAIPDPAERAAFLDRACGSDAEMRRRIDGLLVGAEGSNPLDRPPVDLGMTGAYDSRASQPSVGVVGEVIAGRYRLLDNIGEGGMGSVWRAQQSEPVKRLVAIKLIRAGMDSKAVLARFEAERQALAIMDHPNIARILDGGVHDGRPFFVMELIKGMPITAFCDGRKLTPRERLELFLPVCGAIQHAHQKGIIHRDIKPSNVLVALYDDIPIPKVIDFGIARATGGSLTDASNITAFGGVVGTPQYMSPEQASLNNLDIDTRSDVYSLGVLLYELLAGSPPFGERELQRAGVLEMLRVVREQEPVRPSAKLSTADALPALSANRGTEPKKLTGLLRNELDWIVMRALEKSRERRYESANSFAADVGRYLAGEQVQAHPPTLGYRVRKAYRRNRTAVRVAGAFFCMAMGAVAMGAYLAVRATDAERVAVAARNAAQENEAKAKDAADAERAARTDAEKSKAAALASAVDEKKARELTATRLKQLEKGNDILFDLFHELDIGRDERKQNEPLEAVLAKRLVKAAEQLEGESLGDPLEVAMLQNKLGVSLTSLGHPDRAVPILRKACETYRIHAGPRHIETMLARNNLATAYREDGRSGEALPIFRELHECAEIVLGKDDPRALSFIGNLAECYQETGRLDRALPLYEEAATRSKRVHGERSIHTLWAMHNLALGLRATGKTERALALSRETLRKTTEFLGEDHPHCLSVMSNLAECHREVGELDESVRLHEEMHRLARAKRGPENPQTLRAMNNLAGAYRDADRLGSALPLFEEALRLKRIHLSEDHPETLQGIGNLAATWWTLGRLDRSIPLFEESLRLLEKKTGRRHPYALGAIANLGVNYLDAGRCEEAIGLLEEVWRASENSPELRWTGPALHEAYLKAGRIDSASALVAKLRIDVERMIGNIGSQPHSELSSFGSAMLAAKLYPEAETLLRQCLKLREKSMPNSYSTFIAMSRLGGALLGGRKYAEAEPMLLKGYEGMMARQNEIPGYARVRIPEALGWLIENYTATDRPNEAQKWRTEWEKYPELLPMPRIVR